MKVLGTLYIVRDQATADFSSSIILAISVIQIHNADLFQTNRSSIIVLYAAPNFSPSIPNQITTEFVVFVQT